jgi:CheY-like chemotaxis protein
MIRPNYELARVLIPDRTGETTMSRTVLAIEDDPQVAQLLERGLIYEGYQVRLAPDGQAGLNAIRTQPPDLVVLDWMLPELDGLDVCKRLRTTRTIPILMLTAKDQVPDRIIGLDAGADDYLIKPFVFDERSWRRMRWEIQKGHPKGIRHAQNGSAGLSGD